MIKMRLQAKKTSKQPCNISQGEYYVRQKFTIQKQEQRSSNLH